MSADALDRAQTDLEVVVFKIIVPNNIHKHRYGYELFLRNSGQKLSSCGGSLEDMLWRLLHDVVYGSNGGQPLKNLTVRNCFASFPTDSAGRNRLGRSEFAEICGFLEQNIPWQARSDCFQ